ncbi:MAG: hypothetical protein KGJ02_03925 [Verrucomicrobiota bacterium]|nr:hypothetical protein [Verrucomicrobiota bacterium]
MKMVIRGGLKTADGRLYDIIIEKNENGKAVDLTAFKDSAAVIANRIKSMDLVSLFPDKKLEEISLRNVHDLKGKEWTTEIKSPTQQVEVHSTQKKLEVNHKTEKNTVEIANRILAKQEKPWVQIHDRMKVVNSLLSPKSPVKPGPPTEEENDLELGKLFQEPEEDNGLTIQLRLSKQPRQGRRKSETELYEGPKPPPGRSRRLSVGDAPLRLQRRKSESDLSDKHSKPLGKPRRNSLGHKEPKAVQLIEWPKISDANDLNTEVPSIAQQIRQSLEALANGNLLEPWQKGQLKEFFEGLMLICGLGLKNNDQQHEFKKKEEKLALYFFREALISLKITSEGAIKRATDWIRKEYHLTAETPVFDETPEVPPELP